MKYSFICFVLYHSGQTPAESDYHLLEVARRLEMYGIRLHPAKDREGTKLSLTVAHTGVLVFQVSLKSVQVSPTGIKGFLCVKIYVNSVFHHFRDTQRLTPSTGLKFEN